MADYKLYYYPCRGHAEAIRLLLAYKRIKFEDIGITDEMWVDFKPMTPFGRMPVLEEGGKKLGGSLVILRYLAEKHGVAGSNAWDNAWLANIADFINDFNLEGMKTYFELDDEKREQLVEKFHGETIHKYLGKLDEMAKETGYLCCGKLTWPDLCIFASLITLLSHKEDALNGYSGLAKLKSNIESNADMAKQIDKHIKNKF